MKNLALALIIIGLIAISGCVEIEEGTQDLKEVVNVLNELPEINCSKVAFRMDKNEALWILYPSDAELMKCSGKSIKTDFFRKEGEWLFFEEILERHRNKNNVDKAYRDMMKSVADYKNLSESSYISSIFVDERVSWDRATGKYKVPSNYKWDEEKQRYVKIG